MEKFQLKTSLHDYIYTAEQLFSSIISLNYREVYLRISFYGFHALQTDRKVELYVLDLARILRSESDMSRVRIGKGKKRNILHR